MDTEELQLLKTLTESVVKLSERVSAISNNQELLVKKFSKFVDLLLMNDVIKNELIIDFQKLKWRDSNGHK